MEHNSEITVLQGSEHAGFPGRSLLQFLFHLLIVYLIAEFAVVWAAGQIHNVVLPLLGAPPNESRFSFVFNHLVLFSAVCGVLAGVVAGTYQHKAAQFVWIVPAAILAYKLAVFPAGVFEDRLALAVHHYFAGGFLIPEFHNYHEMFQNWNPDYARGPDQVRFAAPLYVAIAYGCAAYIAERTGIRFPLFGAPRHQHE